MNAQDLKNSILQLAIQGKLVEQRAEEGNAKELLEKIKAEKEQLIKEKKIKKEKPLPEIAEDEIPFEIPENWEWVRLGNCVSNKSGVSYKKDNLNTITQNMIRILRGGNIYDLSYSFKEDDIMLDNSFVKVELILKKNMLITPAVTSLEHIGKMARIEKDYSNVAVGGFVLMLTPHISNDVFSEFLLYSLSSQYHRNICRSITNKSGQAFYNLSREKLMKILVPLPPLEEQKRIVAKIEELMPYIEKYDKAYTKVKALNKKFPEDMQKSILQYAIQGKLVEQRAEEGTAEELYVKIQEEKEKLIKEKKIKKEKPLPEITEEEIPFEIPESWKWVRLGKIIWYLDAGKSPSCIKQSVKGKEWGVITTTAIQTNFFDEDQNKILPSGFDVKLEMQVIAGDVLITRAGPTNRTGVACVAERITHNLILSDKTVRINMSDKLVDKHFITMMINTPAIRLIIFNMMSGMDKQQVNISQDKIKNIIIPLPPLEEQKRIVAKIEEMLLYCKQLIK